MFGAVPLAEYKTSKDLLISVRPMQADDTPTLLEIFGRMGAASRYTRFHTSLDAPDDSFVWAEAEQIAQAIGRSSFGLLAFVDQPEIENSPVAGVRWVLTGPDEAELAVSVIDEFQGLGIGTRLVELLIDEARAAGIRRLLGTVQSDNAAVWGLLRKLPYQVTRQQDGATTTIAIDLGHVRPAER